VNCGRGSWVVVVVVGLVAGRVVGRGRGRGRIVVVSRGLWSWSSLVVVVGRASWSSVFEWVVVVVVGHGRGHLVSLTFRCGLSCRLIPSQDQSLVPSLVPSQPQVNPAAWRSTLGLALHVSVGGARLRLTLSHSVAARTAAACLWLCGMAPRLFPSLCTRGWAARGSDLRWVARGSDLRSCTASQLVLRRVCGWAAWGKLSPLLYTRECGQCTAPTYALAQRRGACRCAASVIRGLLGSYLGPTPSTVRRAASTRVQP